MPLFSDRYVRKSGGRHAYDYEATWVRLYDGRLSWNAIVKRDGKRFARPSGSLDHVAEGHEREVITPYIEDAIERQSEST